MFSFFFFIIFVFHSLISDASQVNYDLFAIELREYQHNENKQIMERISICRHSGTIQSGLLKSIYLLLFFSSSIVDFLVSLRNSLKVTVLRQRIYVNWINKKRKKQHKKCLKWFLSVDTGLSLSCILPSIFFYLVNNIHCLWPTPNEMRSILCYFCVSIELTKCHTENVCNNKRKKKYPIQCWHTYLSLTQLSPVSICFPLDFHYWPQMTSTLIHSERCDRL